VNAVTLQTMQTWANTGDSVFLSADGTQLMTPDANGMNTWSLATFQTVASVQGQCQAVTREPGKAYAMWPDRSRFAVLEPGEMGSIGSVCVISTTP
jgi:hypothetical protein